MIRVEGYDNLFRDEKTGAIVNNDVSSYNTYMTMKKKRLQERKEIDDMKQDITEMKQMLKLLIDKL
tara:strand:+ start:11462 stop:11659 length:198 start_codon:yes stop_codon:yes gene_type:complete